MAGVRSWRCAKCLSFSGSSDATFDASVCKSSAWPNVRVPMKTIAARRLHAASRCWSGPCFAALLRLRRCRSRRRISVTTHESPTAATSAVPSYSQTPKIRSRKFATETQSGVTGSGDRCSAIPVASIGHAAAQFAKDARPRIDRRRAFARPGGAVAPGHVMQFRRVAMRCCALGHPGPMHCPPR